MDELYLINVIGFGFAAVVFLPGILTMLALRVTRLKYLHSILYAYSIFVINLWLVDTSDLSFGALISLYILETIILLVIIVIILI